MIAFTARPPFRPVELATGRPTDLNRAMALAAFAGGLAYDTTGSYTYALAPCVGLMLGAAFVSLLINEERPVRHARTRPLEAQLA